QTRRPIPNLSLTPGPKPTTGFGPFCLRVIPLPASVKIHPTRRPPWRGPMMIDRVVRFLLPRQDLFFTLLEQIAAKMTAAATVFMELTTASGHEQLTAIAARLKVIENEADAVYRAAIEALFADGNDARELVRQKDMLFSLEAGVDKCEDAMDAIRSVIVKNG